MILFIFYHIQKGEVQLFEKITSAISSINSLIWGLPMIVLLFGTHIFMTFRTGFIQKKIFRAIKLSVSKDSGAKGDISQFAALTTALASTIGTGNIIGVGTAIVLGGPGAVFWCWLTGIFGIATKYAESLIAVKYRVQTKDGSMLGGAMYALERGLKQKWLGILFAVFTSLAAFGIGCGVQVNAISSVVNTNINKAVQNNSSWFAEFINAHPSAVNLAVGITAAILAAFVIFGGVKSISKVCEMLVPVMAVFYVLGCIIILIFNFDYLDDAVILILKSAFTKTSAAGGLVGSGIMAASRYGIARGLFSNESGMGSAPIVASAAQTKNPVRQALVSSTGTFWDTVVVCLMTGLVLVSSILKNDNIDVTGLEGGELTTAAFSQIGISGNIILVIGIISFAFSTILGWSYYSDRCIDYLFGSKGLIPYRIIFLIVLVAAPCINLSAVWDMADMLNAFMAIPNLIAVIGLSGVISSETKHYLENLDEEDKTPIPVIDK